MPSRVPPALLLVAPIVLLGAGAIVLALVGEQAGQAVEERRTETDAGVEPVAHAPGDDRTDAPSDAGVTLAAPADPDRFAPDGAILAEPSGTDYECLQPALEIAREPACERG